MSAPKLNTHHFHCAGWATPTSPTNREIFHAGNPLLRLELEHSRPQPSPLPAEDVNLEVWGAIVRTLEAVIAAKVVDIESVSCGGRPLSKKHY